jgi:hypothetical protein
MRRAFGSAFTAATILLAGAGVVAAQDASRAVAGGGISVPGWQGRSMPARRSGA